METSALTPADAREDFGSGDLNIDEFFKRYAGQNQFRHHLGVTFCARESGRITAFATLAAGAVDPQDLLTPSGAHLSKYPAPVLRLARLAVDQRYQGHGIAAEMLTTVAVIGLEMRARVGCIGVIVDAKPASAGFYERHGFHLLPIASRTAGAGARPIRLFTDLRRLVRSAAAASNGLTPADSLAAEMRRRASELGLSADEIRSAVDRLLG